VAVHQVPVLQEVIKVCKVKALAKAKRSHRWPSTWRIYSSSCKNRALQAGPLAQAGQDYRRSLAPLQSKVVALITISYTMKKLMMETEERKDPGTLTQVTKRMVLTSLRPQAIKVMQDPGQAEVSIICHLKDISSHQVMT
jgi:hypothetical protein